ncbi:MAG: PD40 domain-containing protein [Myxococcaceae bacterium]|nr:PD40 domain-containing protein [Myxococcaceae bacterium]
MQSPSRWLTLGFVVFFSACNCSNDLTVGNTGGGSATAGGAGTGGGSSTAGGTATGGGTSNAGGTTASVFDVQPAMMQVLTVPLGAQAPTLTFSSTLNGQPVSAGWNVDQGSIGQVAPGTGSNVTFTPSGRVGGLVRVRAGLNGQTLERVILVKLESTQNGVDLTDPTQAAQVPAGVPALTSGGGVGGIGGEGLGPPVTDSAILTALSTPAGNGQAQNLELLYPYDGTVFPRRLLAPNVMWRWSMGDADAVKLTLATSTGSFRWSGTFGRPAILTTTGGAFIRHPIPQSIWRAATDTAGGSDTLKLEVTLARGGQAYGPVSQTWTIAPARLTGTIYYNSYGTQLAKNYPGAVGGDGQFGGAVLSIRAGDPGPRLTAGANGGPSECRVCHSVAANGSRLVVQHDDGRSSAYDLTPTGSTETVLAARAEFPAMYPDGTMMLAPNGTLSPLPNSATPLPATGLSAISTSIGTPAFSPDGKKLVFNPINGSLANPAQKLVVMDFEIDAGTYTFSNATTVADFTGQPAETRPGWGAFFPDGKSVVFHKQSAAGIDGNGLGDLRSRKGAKAEIAWTKTTDAASVTPLNKLNGRNAAGASVLPSLTTPITLACTADGHAVGGIDPSHADDVNLNYEPTVAPIATGGYAWVVFTSRRLYGNVAQIPPFCSDPRGVDLVQNITPKKLWVAAVDLSGTPGNDFSHPAFYLPGQELLAGNSRAFWTLDPCKNDGNGCETGDECCNGYCQPGDAGTLVCSNTPPTSSCSMLQERCMATADCCNPNMTVCVNGFCALIGPQ